MGICQSCLGRSDRDDYDENEEARLLYEDGLQYGSFGDPAMGDDETIEAQRENEALQRVVAKTSNNMVDVFEIVPHDSARGAPFAYAGQGARVARYQHLVSKLGGGHEDGGLSGVKVEWLVDDTVELRSNRSASTSIRALEEDDGGGPLVGTFADAAAAMQ